MTKQNLISILEVIGKFLLATVIMFAIAIFLMIPFFVIYGMEVLSFQRSPETVAGFLLMISQPLAFLAAVWLMLVMFDRKRQWTLGFRDKQAGRHLLSGMGMGILLMSAAFLLIWLMGGLQPLSLNWNGEVARSLAVWFIFFIFVAVNEEVLARGYVQGLLKARLGVTAGIIGNSLIFAALHLANAGVLDSPLPLLNLFLAGVLMALAREQTGSLWAPIGIHLTWNFFQGNLYGFAVSGMDTPTLITIKTQGPGWLNGSSFGAEGSLIGLLVLIGGILYYIFRLRKD